MLREARRNGNGNGASSPAPAEPIPGYGQLTAAEIATRLRTLSLDDLKAVEVHEARHHRRRSVLDAVREARSAIVHGHATASF